MARVLAVDDDHVIRGLLEVNLAEIPVSPAPEAVGAPPPTTPSTPAPSTSATHGWTSTRILVSFAVAVVGLVALAKPLQDQIPMRQILNNAPNRIVRTQIKFRLASFLVVTIQAVIFEEWTNFGGKLRINLGGEGF